MPVGPSAQGGAIGELSDRTLELLWDDGELALSRSTGRDGSRPLLVVAPARTSPETETLARLERALALRDLLDPGCTARPLTLGHHLGRPLLVLEDPGGELLGRLVGSPWDLTVFLRVAIGLAGALRRLHARGLVHKDVTPANVLVNVATGDVWLTGFRMAFRVPRELQAPDPPRTIAGTLAYMAPEQTGRMHRSIDARSDLYALGIVLYEMLTGSVPFTATDPIELMHCHVARQPEAPAARGTDIPEPIAALVLKLLAKAPEDRYQTAAGVEADLRHCLAAWQSAARIAAFPLGTHDVPDQIQAPEKLYGRAPEIAALLAAFDAVTTDGRPTLALVSGYPGIGKSSVVREWHARVAARCRFACGKVDQDKRDAPYATLAQVLRSLVRPLLAHDDADLALWRNAIRDAAHPSGQLLVNLVPEIELIIGPQPTVPELPLPDAQRRFHGLIGRFLAVFARPEQPLCVFLDDLQWLDAATLDLVEHLATHSDQRHLLLIGAYRSNEVGAGHPLRRVMQRIRTAGTSVREIALAPLGLDDVGQLVADAVRAERDRTRLLAELVQEKTAGNPFFAHQFLSTLAEEGWLTFDANAGAWTWELEGIRAKGYTDSVVDLVIGKLIAMPAATQRALRELACLGNRASLATLRLLGAASDAEIHETLSDAVRLGLVVRLDDAYAFPHDRVHEAAYALIPDRERAALHVRIGRALAAGLDAPACGPTIFDVVNQLNRGHALITSDEERAQVAALSLAAGEQARAATACGAALSYFVAGSELIGANAWQRHYGLAFALELRRAECEFLLGDLGAAEERLALLAARAGTLVDGAAVACLRVAVYTTLDLYHQALEVGREFLRTAGIAWSLHPTDDDVRQEYERMWAAMAGRPIEALADLPAMTEPERRATMDVLVLLLEPSLFTESNQFALALGKMVNLSLEYGNSDGSSLAYAQLIMVLGPRFGDYPSGFRFGQLGLDLVEHHGLDRYRARVYLVVGHHVLPWMRGLDASRALAERAFETAQHAGDLTFAAYSGTVLVANLLASGAALGQVQRTAESHLAFARRAGFGGVVHALDTQIALIRKLRGTTAEPAIWNAPESDIVRAEPGALTTWWSWIRALQARFHFGDFAGALEATAQAGAFTWTSSTFPEVAEWHFYGALAHAASHDAASADEQPRHRDALRAHHEQIVQSARYCPATFENRTALVGAEIARLDGRELDAEHLYEEAIRLAREQRFTPNEALANELAARFHMARGFQTIANAYLRNARDGYLRWGADAKVRQLDRLYPHLHATSAPVHAAGTLGAPVEQLELATVVRASQAVSGEIVLEKLIDTLMVIALEHAGAERGLLILPRGDEQRIEAEATSAVNAVTVRLRDAPVTSMDLPESVLRFVTRTHERVILDDAVTHEAFASDPYIHRTHARSILCLPLLKHAELAGVLYLENNLAPAVFTAARIALLELLASQAAISLENAHLYEDLRNTEQTVRRKEQELRLTIDAIPEIVWTARPDGVVDSFNQRMLDFVGSTAPEAGAMRWDALVHPEDFPATMEKWSASLGSGEANQTEFRARRHDGEYRWLMVRALPLRDETGAILRWYGSSVDIQDRKEAEVTIRAQEAELRTLVDFVPHHILVVDAEWRLLRANRSGLDYLGLTFDELAQNSTFADYHPDDLDTLRTAIESASRGISPEFEVRARRHDGQYRWHLFRFVPLRDEHGEIIRWYITATDIEDRKRTEERVLEENLALREEVDKVSMFEEIVGTCAPLRAVLANLSQVAPTDSTVLITGETGTGKELVARAIHKQSRRSARAFISVNCGAIPPTLVLSELFGHEKGAFTGALQRRLGRFELADGGTIFLDEIGDLPADAQLALLRVLQERTFERVGGTRPIAVDVRVIAATNRDLEAAMADGQFRSDLFYRLNVFPIEVPPLRERKEDIPLLIAYFVDRYAGKAGKPIRTLDKRTMDLLQAYRWPGNVRELQNVIERSIIVCDTDTFVVDESWLLRESTRTGGAPTTPLADELGARERQMIETALAETRGRVSGPTGAAARLGMPPSTLESRIKVLGIAKSRFKTV